MKRVVVTGIGCITPYGYGVDPMWSSVVSGKSCVTKLHEKDLAGLDSKIGGKIRHVDDGGFFDPKNFLPPKEVNRMDRFTSYALIATLDAFNDSGLTVHFGGSPIAPEEKAGRCGVIIGCGAGGMSSFEKTALEVATEGNESYPSPFFLPYFLISSTVGRVAMQHGFQGYSSTVVVACASGNQAIIDAANVIARGDADVMISGGTESPYAVTGLKGFMSIKALSKRNDDPEAASRPYDVDRDGFVMSEGSAILILEEYEHAKKRGAKIYAEISGYGVTNDAYHIVSPRPEGYCAGKAVEQALGKAGMNVSDVDYVNSHGTSTKIGDLAEITSLRNVLGDDIKNIAISSTKSATGHMLGAASALEAIICIKAMENNIAPPTINLSNVDEGFEDLNLVPNKAQERKIDSVISNSFGFGGFNTCVAFKKC